MLKLDDIVHPMLREFADASESGLFQARITAYVRVEPHPSESQVVLRYGNGDPALVLRRFDRGQVAFFTTSANMDWNNLAAKGDFVPLMLNVAGHLARRRGEHRTVTVGQRWAEPLSAAEASLRCEVTAADGAKHPGEIVQDGDSLSLVYGPAARPGFGVVRVGSRAVSFATNVTNEDSDLKAISTQQLALLTEKRIRFVTDLADISAAREAGRSKELATVVLCVVLALLFAELLLATKFGAHGEDEV